METRRTLISMLCIAAFPLASNAITFTDRGAWETASGSWTDVDLASQVAEFGTLPPGDPLNLPFGQTLSFDKDLEGRQVPGSWGSWSNGNEPRVLFTGVTEIELVGTFSAPVQKFGLEMQPDFSDLFLMTLKLSDGSTVSQPVHGDGGAAFFGWISDNPSHVVSMTISLDARPRQEGFAIGRMVQGNVPGVPDAASTGILMLVSLAAFGALKRVNVER